MTLREVLGTLISGFHLASLLDEPAMVRLERRDKDNMITHYALIPVHWINMNGHICIDESLIEWKEFH